MGLLNQDTRVLAFQSVIGAQGQTKATVMELPPPTWFFRIYLRFDDARKTRQRMPNSSWWKLIFPGWMRQKNGMMNVIIFIRSTYTLKNIQHSRHYDVLVRARTHSYSYRRRVCTFTFHPSELRSAISSPWCLISSIFISVVKRYFRIIVTNIIFIDNIAYFIPIWKENVVSIKLAIQEKLLL